ncbi:hypothetical protein ACSSS7_004100 [Eimeria intestinalis]
MKVTSGHRGGSTPVLSSVLKKEETQLLKKSRGGGVEKSTVGGKKVDRVKEYMEQKFYEQFMPKRDPKSRIRKLALDKDTLRRARGNNKRHQPPPVNSREAGPQPLKKAAISVKRKSRKKKAKRSLSKPPKEICAMVLSSIRDL